LKKFISIALIFSVILYCLSSCTATSPEDETPKDTSLLQIFDKNLLTIGYSDAQFPILYKEDKEKDSDIAGFGADLLRDICKRLVVNCKLKQVAEQDAEKLLLSGEIDIFFGSGGEEKYPNLLLSAPIFECSSPVFLVKESEKDVYSDFLKLKDKTVGYLNLSASGNIVGQIPDFITDPKKYKSYLDFDTAVEALKKDELDAVVMDNLSAYIVMLENEDSFAVVDVDAQKVTDSFIMAFNPERAALNNKIADILDLLLKDGSLDFFSRHWFGENVIILPPLAENKLFSEGQKSPHIVSEEIVSTTASIYNSIQNQKGNTPSVPPKNSSSTSSQTSQNSTVR